MCVPALEKQGTLYIPKHYTLKVHLIPKKFYIKLFSRSLTVSKIRRQTLLCWTPCTVCPFFDGFTGYLRISKDTRLQFFTSLMVFKAQGVYKNLAFCKNVKHIYNIWRLRALFITIACVSKRKQLNGFLSLTHAILMESTKQDKKEEIKINRVSHLKKYKFALFLKNN